jgi:hypothetical protein
MINEYELLIKNFIYEKIITMTFKLLIFNIL